MKTAIELLGKSRAKRYYRYGMLTIGQYTGEDKFMDADELEAIMVGNYAYTIAEYEAYKMGRGGKSQLNETRFDQVYRHTVHMNVQECELDAVSRLLKGDGPKR